jgi:hypothetical protein
MYINEINDSMVYKLNNVIHYIYSYNKIYENMTNINSFRVAET